MAMSEQALKSSIEAELSAAGFNLNSAPKTKAFCAAIAKAVVAEVKKASVSTPAGAGSIS